LASTIKALDSSYHFSGVSKIATPESGYITELPHQLGDYVQDGEQLAVISNANSFGFILNLPYELHKYVVANKAVDVILPDSTRLDGVIASFMPIIDSGISNAAGADQSVVLLQGSLKTLLQRSAS
jgi:multidrug resistance efflux pump